MRDFVDFWSINRWLCQYNIIDDGECRWVNEATIVHPLATTPYHSTNRFNNWCPEKLHQYLQALDTWTANVCCFEHTWKSGKVCPAFEFKIFPCADGSFYAAYPTAEPKHYVRAFDFSASLLSSKRSPQERLEEAHQIWLDKGQGEIAATARRLWLCVLREREEK